MSCASTEKTTRGGEAAFGFGNRKFFLLQPGGNVRVLQVVVRVR